MLDSAERVDSKSRLTSARDVNQGSLRFSDRFTKNPVMRVDKSSHMWDYSEISHSWDFSSDSSCRGGGMLESNSGNVKWVMMHLHACLFPVSESQTQETVNLPWPFPRSPVSNSHRLSAPSAGHQCEVQGATAGAQAPGVRFVVVQKGRTKYSVSPRLRQVHVDGQSN